MFICRTIILVAATSLVAAACSMPRQLALLGNDGEFIRYTGSVTLSGFYFSDDSNVEIQQFVCFFPDTPSQKLLPQDSHTDPFHWMCFSNSTEARDLLELNHASGPHSTCHKGLAKITIRDYSRYIAESEGVSFAELTKVHQHSAASTLPCEAL